MNFFKEQHDKLLELKPEGVDHDAANCIICNPETDSKVSTQENSTEGGDMKTYTEDEFTAAVEAAVTPLQAELDNLRASLAQGEAESQIATAVAEAEARVTALQAELDKAELRATEAEKSRDEVIAYLEAEVQAAAEAELRETKRSERRNTVKEVASFSDEYIDANLDRWVAMDDESFEAVLEDWKAVSKTPAKASEDVSDITSALAETAMNNTRTNVGSSSDAKTVFGAHLSGTDVRKIY